jgi:hypothetical protein
MAYQIWPFVVARNSTLDWRPVLAPDVLMHDGREFSLVLETTGSHPIDLTRRTWRDAAENSWSIAYRSTAALTSVVDGDGDAQLLDRFGRPVYLIEGVLARGEESIPLQLGAVLIERSHRDGLAAFARFWSEESELVGPVPSATLDLSGDARFLSATRRSIAAGTSSGRRLRVIAAVAIAIVLVAYAAAHR